MPHLQSLLLAVTTAAIWLDFSDEAQYLLHLFHTPSLQNNYVFLAIQAIFWMAVEYKVLVLESLLEAVVY